MSQEFYDCISEWADRCGELQKQLAAKEREIERLKYQLQVHADLIGENEFSLRKQVTHLTSQLADLKGEQRRIAQIAIEEVGASGPENAYSAVGRLVGKVQLLVSQLATVREAAIKFAQNVRRNGRWQEDEWIEAGKFLEQAHAAHDVSSKEGK